MSDTRLGGRWLQAARAGWIVLAALSVGLFIAAVPLRISQLSTPCGPEPCLLLQATVHGAEALQRELVVDLESYAAMVAGVESFLALTFVLAGVATFWRKSDDWMALVASLGLVLSGTGVSALVQALSYAEPALRPVVLAWPALGTAFIAVLFYLFPSGRFVPGWTRWPAMAVLALLLLLVLSGRLYEPIWFAVTLAGVGLGLYAQVYRYRRVSSPVERQQTKWVVFGFGITAVGTAAFALPPLLFPDSINPISLPTSSVADFIYRVPFNLTFGFIPLSALPISMAVSILRYRLWDADLVITRSVAYGGLTATLLVIYFGSVVLLQGTFRATTGQDSPLAIVASTLLIAVLFTPLRNRLQLSVDRRFYRRKYNADRSLSAFSAVVREAVDMDSLSEELLEVVQRTVQPSSVELWLRRP